LGNGSRRSSRRWPTPGPRPEEAIALHRENIYLPPEVGEDHPDFGKQFGEFRL
jgi:hypothetical protein